MSTEPTFIPGRNFVAKLRSNIQSDLIEITEDKLENILLKHLNKLRLISGWLTPVSLFITFLVVLLSAEFKKFLYLNKDVWQAVFVMALIITIIWSIKAVYLAITNSKNVTIEYLINEVKNNNQEEEEEEEETTTH